MDMPTRRPLAEVEITASLYFWWLAFLRCSKDYWWCCQQNGECQDSRLVKVWEDFGDIFKYQCFMHWWQENGSRLFDSPQIEIEFIKQLGAGLELLLKSDLVIARPGMICIAIPEYLDTIEAKTIIWQAWQLARVRGKHYGVDAKYQLFDLCLRSKKTIIRSYKSLVLTVSVEQSAASEPIHKWGDFEMGRYLNVSPKNKVLKHHRIALGEGRGIRDLTALAQDAGFLLLAGPSGGGGGGKKSALGEAYEFWHWPGPGSPAVRLGPLGPATTSDQAKAEGLLILSQSSTHIEGIVFHDGPKNGAPHGFRLSPPAPR